MYIHPFVFRWTAGTTELQKTQMKEEIRRLQGKIPGLVETHVGTNISLRGQDYEFGGVMKFVTSLDCIFDASLALDAYFRTLSIVRWASGECR